MVASNESECHSDEKRSDAWRSASTEAPLAVVAHELRMRYNTLRTDRKPRKGALRYAQRKQMVSVTALRGVSFTARSGEFIGIIGRNGSGKSTLLRTLAGLERPSSGTVLASAKPVLLGVSAAMMPELTGAENVKLGALAMGLVPQQADEVFDEVVELSALGDAIDLPMKTYSSGMGARLKFAISLAANPSILMIDEALATGDATFMERSRRAMDQMLERAGTVFLVNHAAQTIENMCSRAIWMEGGQVVLDGDAVEVARRYRWFAHILAQGDEEKAMGLLRAAITEGRAQRHDRRAALETTHGLEPLADVGPVVAGESPAGHTDTPSVEGAEAEARTSPAVSAAVPSLAGKHSSGRRRKPPSLRREDSVYPTGQLPAIEVNSGDREDGVPSDLSDSPWMEEIHPRPTRHRRVRPRHVR